MAKQISKTTCCVLALVFAGFLSGCEAVTSVDSINQEEVLTEAAEETAEVSEENQTTETGTNEKEESVVINDEVSESRNVINPSVYLSANTRFNVSSSASAGTTRKTTATTASNTSGSYNSAPSYSQNNQWNSASSDYTYYETPSDYNNEERFDIPDGWDSKTVERRGNTTVTTYTYTFYYDGPTTADLYQEPAPASQVTAPDPVAEAPAAPADPAPAPEVSAPEEPAAEAPAEPEAAE